MPRQRPSLSILTVLAFLALEGFAPGQPEWDWRQKAPAAGPAARHSHAMAFDSVRGRTLLFGGFDDTGRFGDTWEWDGSAWRQAPGAQSPPPRQEHALAFDAARGRTVLFGGLGDSGRLADTWEWDGSGWRQAFPASSPPARSQHALAYDAARGRVLLFGGLGNSGRLADTWEWDGTQWRLATPSPSPSARRAHALAFDPARARILLFGGHDGAVLLADTWDGNALSWNRLPSLASPPAREGHTLIHDLFRGRSVLFGGEGGSGRLADTWEWDGDLWLWVQTPTKPTARSLHAMAFDTLRGRIVLFGGQGTGLLGDTWEYGPDGDGSFSPLGPGCPGSHAKVPVLSHQGLPELMRSFTLDLADGPPGQGSALFMDMPGTSMDLTPYGAPGCRAFLRPGLLLAWVGLIGSGGAWAQPPSISIPGDPALLGGRFACQAFIHDPTANALGWITSTGLLGTVGFSASATQGAIVETFAGTLKLDPESSGARWGGGSLKPGRAGGSGLLGSLEILSGTRILDTDGELFPGSVTLTGAPIQVSDGVFSFDRIRIAPGATLRLTGTNPARLLARGRIVIEGYLVANGETPALHGGSSTTGGPGGKGVLGGASGGQGGSRLGFGSVDGLSGGDVVVPAGHPRAAQATGTGGKGSPAHPAGALNSLVTFNGFYGYYSQQIAGGGGGGSFFSLGTQGRSTVPELRFPQDAGPGGSAGKLFPLLPLDPSTPSVLQLLIGGSGGGGAGIHPAESSSFYSVQWRSGAGGGGGGGAILLQAGGDLTLEATGFIQARGGQGGPSMPGIGASVGGGGSGGSVLLQVAGTAALSGLVDVTGGEGLKANGGIVMWSATGGNGGNGYIRLEHDPVIPHTSLTGFKPAATAENTGLLAETSPITGAASLWYDTGGTQVAWLRFELKVKQGNQIVVYSDDPSYGVAPTLGVAPVAFFLQGAVLDQGRPTSTTGWVRTTSALGLATPRPTAVRFVILMDTSLLAPSQPLEILEARILFAR